MYRPKAIESRQIGVALWVSALVHGTFLLVSMCASWMHAAAPSTSGEVESAPPPPEVELLVPELAKLEPQLAATEPPAPPDPAPELIPVDPLGFSGVDARPDESTLDAGLGGEGDAAAEPDAQVDARVRPDARPKPDARPDAGEPLVADLAAQDAGVASDGADAADGSLLAQAGDAGGVGDAGVVADPGTGGSDEPDGARDDRGVESVANATGASANLLAYAPAGHVVTALVRFDRVRKTRWAAPIEKLFSPMPDHQTIVGDRALKLSELFESLVISSPEPTDPRQTTLVVRTALTRATLRDTLDEPDAPVRWTVSAGGMHGARGAGARVLPGDPRTYLSWRGDRATLANARDLPGLLAPVAGDLDTAVATAPLPAWLTRMEKIESESGDKSGPVLVLTMEHDGQPVGLPPLGLGVDQLPTPTRFTVALQIDSKGFLVRGHGKFASDGDAAAFVTAVEAMKAAVASSVLMKSVLRQNQLYNAAVGLGVKQQGDRVSFATSLGPKEAEGLLSIAAVLLERYFSAAGNASGPPGRSP